MGAGARPLRLVRDVAIVMALTQIWLDTKDLS